MDDTGDAPNDAGKSDPIPKPEDVAEAERAKKGSPFLTTKQAAFYLGKSPRTLEKWRRKHKGPKYHRHGRTPHYLVRDLDASRTDDTT